MRIASYNVLATAYIRPELYPRTPKALLIPQNRIPALLDHLVRLQADLYCLQEVEQETVNAIESTLGPLGYGTQFARKGGLRPDGCATVYRRRCFDLLDSVRLEYDEDLARPSSGHIAQIIVLGAGAGRLGVANTHLKWDAPDTPPDEQYGCRQVCELLSALRAERLRRVPWIICGDLNALPTSEVVQALHGAGFTFTHSAYQSGATCNANGTAKMIDYIFFQPPLRAEPVPLAPVSGTTPLPGPTEPSDHVPVVARLDWQ